MDWKLHFSPLTLNSNDPRPTLAIALLDEIGAITLVGDDKKSYLQGQITCDVVTLDKAQSTLGAHCDAKGKVWSAFRLFHHRDGYAMVQDQSALDVELREIKKYAVFSKVDITISEDIALGVIGAQAESFIDSLSDARGAVRELPFGTAVHIDAQRWLLLISPDAIETLVTESNATLTDGTLWDLHDIETAQPRLNAAQQNAHIPQALNLQALGGISFQKGCYTGQETVARAKYRGMNKRAMFSVKSLQSAPDLSRDEPVQLERAVGENWRSAGELLVSFQFADGVACGLVVLPNDIEQDTPLRLANAPESLWQIQALPYALDAE